MIKYCDVIVTSVPNQKLHTKERPLALTLFKIELPYCGLDYPCATFFFQKKMAHAKRHTYAHLSACSEWHGNAIMFTYWSDIESSLKANTGGIELLKKSIN